MNTTIIVTTLISTLVGLLIGTVVGYFYKWLLNFKRREEAKEEAQVIVDTAKNKERDIILEAKEEAIKIRSAGQAEIRERRSEVNKIENRLSFREEKIDQKSTEVDKKERDLNQKETEINKVSDEVESIRESQVTRMEEIANLTISEAQNQLLDQAEHDIQREISILYRDIGRKADLEAENKAREVIGIAIQKLASDVVSEATLTTVPLPSDELKGRLIGREGRNIRAIEKATGVDLLIDEVPEVVTLSCFDPIRREIARLSVTKLIADGRIHPARIEEVVEKCTDELSKTIGKIGQDTILDTRVRGINPELSNLLGRLQYRFSYGENVLTHSIEVAYIGAAIAAEIGGDVKVTKLGGLLHDIGKSLTHEIEGPHAEIGANVAEKNNIPKHVCATIREHHDDDHSSVESYIVAAADAISAARPGARRDTVERYIQRMEALEDVAGSFDGVEKCFAVHAGREVRVMVEPDSIDDLEANKMAIGIVKKIEEELAYPGQIKVTVIRESRSIEYAR